MDRISRYDRPRRRLRLVLRGRRRTEDLDAGTRSPPIDYALHYEGERSGFYFPILYSRPPLERDLLMAAHTPVRSGDIGEERSTNLSGVANLDDVTGVDVHLRKGTTVVTIAATVTDSATGEITFPLGTVATDWLPAGPEVGLWEIEYEVSFSDGRVLSWPGDDYDEIRVIAEIA